MKGLPRREIIFLYSVTKRYEDCYIFFDNFIDNVNFLYGACSVGGEWDFLAKAWLLYLFFNSMGTICEVGLPAIASPACHDCCRACRAGFRRWQAGATNHTNLRIKNILFSTVSSPPASGGASLRGVVGEVST